MDLLDYLFILLSIGLGLFGWLAPAYTMRTLDLHKGETSMGPSEIRASAGALFIGLGVGALVLQSPLAVAMLGFAWAGAAVGRATSLIVDGQTRKKWGFFAVEAAVGLGAILTNL